MAYAMTKQGSLDNCVTYEFVCDTVNDMNAIENKYRTIGTVAIVLKGESDGLEVYIAGSDKQWNSLSAIGSGGGASGGSSDSGNSLPIELVEIPEQIIEMNNIVINDDNGKTISMDTTLLQPGPATLQIGNDTFIINGEFQAYDDYDLYEASDNSDNIGIYIAILSSTSAEVYLYVYDNDSENGQTVRLIFPGRTGLISPIENLYLGTNEDGTGGSKVATIDEVENRFALKDDAIFTNSISLNRASSTIGQNSIATGENVQAIGSASHAEGSNTIAESTSCHAEGNHTTASGDYSHAEGNYTTALESYSHAEGSHTTASGYCSHAEGMSNTASGMVAHAEGTYTEAAGMYSHVAGKFNIIDNKNSVIYWIPSHQYQIGDIVRYNPHSDNYSGGYVYICRQAHTSPASSPQGLGYPEWARIDLFYFAEIVGNGADSDHRSNARALDWNGNEHLKGDLYVHCNADSSGGTKVVTADSPKLTGTLNLGRLANSTEGTNSIALGKNIVASGNYSVATGQETNALGDWTHTEGMRTYAVGNYSHAEGLLSTALGAVSHAEGGAIYETCHLTGDADATVYTYGGGDDNCLQPKAYVFTPDAYAQVVSKNTITGKVTLDRTLGALNNQSCYVIFTYAEGQYSHVEGLGTTAIVNSSHVQGTHNVLDTTYPTWAANTSYSVGDKVKRNGIGWQCISANSNSSFISSNWTRLPSTGETAFVVGNGTSTSNRSNALQMDWNGNLKLAGDIYTGCSNDSTGGTKLARIPDPPSTDGTYTLQATVSSGTITYTWVAST